MNGAQMTEKAKDQMARWVNRRDALDRIIRDAEHELKAHTKACAHWEKTFAEDSASGEGYGVLVCDYCGREVPETK